MDALRLGIDIGGTKVTLGIVREDGAVCDALSQPIDKTRSHVDILQHVVSCAQALLAKHRLRFAEMRCVGVGVPGTVDPQTGFLRNAPNLGWQDLPCGEILSRLTGQSVRMMQDSRASAWGEYLFGAERGACALVSITLGTGIGCGIVLGGQIYAGGQGAAGEVGHINAVPDGRLCGCGRRGCCEAYASGTGIALGAQEFPSLRGCTSEQVFELAGQGSADARRLIAQAVGHLGRTLSAAINLLSPNALVFSGGMCVQEELFVRPLMADIRNRAYRISAENIRMSISTLGSRAPMIGASMLDKHPGGIACPR